MWWFEETILLIAVLTNITSRIDGIVKDVADLKASLQFSQNDISEQQEKIVSMSTAVSSLQETVNKYFQGTIYLENQIKNVLVEKLDLDSAPEIDRAHRTGTRQDGTSKPRTVVCKFTGYKVKESILRKANIFSYG